MVKTRGRPKKERPAPPKRAPRQKQGYLDPSLAPVTVAELETLSENFVSARDAWQKMGLTMQDASAQLLAEMQTRHMTEYEYDGKLIKVENLTKVKVNKIKGEPKHESNGEESDGGEE